MGKILYYIILKFLEIKINLIKLFNNLFNLKF